MIHLEDIRHLVEYPDQVKLDRMIGKSALFTRQYFGRDIALYTPLYLDNHCDGGCTYCGFNRFRDIQRKKLTLEEIVAEMEVISGWGIDHVLLLTGESPQSASLSYLLSAVRLGRRFFSTVTLEVYPLEEDEYRQLFVAGADDVVLYQETYDRNRYRHLHPCGKKADYDFRYLAPLRMARAGVRRVTLGVLLGLADTAVDLHALFCHLELLQREFPGVEYQLSFPRLVPVAGDGPPLSPVSDRQLLAAISLARLLFPRVGISLSTRESAVIRDLALAAGVTRISAGSRTCVGGYASGQEDSVQFAVRDHRSVPEVVARLKHRGWNPVFSDWRSLEE